MVFDTTTKQRTYAFFVLQEMDLQHEWCAHDVLYVFAHTFWSFQLISLLSDFFSEVPDSLLQQVHQQEAWPDNRMYACYPVHRLADLPCRHPLPSTSIHWDVSAWNAVVFIVVKIDPAPMTCILVWYTIFVWESACCIMDISPYGHMNCDSCLLHSFCCWNGSQCWIYGCIIFCICEPDFNAALLQCCNLFICDVFIS